MRTIDNFGRVLEVDAVDTHVQNNPSMQWAIEHSRGREIIGTCYDENGEVILPDIDQSDLNTCLINFTSARRGRFTYK